MTDLWPSDLPQYALARTYSEQPEINVARFDPSVGMPVLRPRSRIDTDVMTFATRMSDVQIESFNSFYKDTLIDGIRPFLFTDPRTTATTIYAFTDAPDCKAIGPRHYDVTMKLRRLYINPPFDPFDLFVGDTGGLWWPSNPADGSLWQDSARTTLCTAAGDPVGAMGDQSGNGNHVLQATAGKRPILRNSGALWWLEFDGVDDYLTISYTSVNPTTRISAFQEVSWVANAAIFSAGVAAGGVLRQRISSPTMKMFDGSDGPGSTDLAIGFDGVATEIFNGASSKLAINNGSYATGDAGNIASSPGGFTVGARQDSTSASAILFYGVVQISRVLTDVEIASCRTFFGNKAGLTL